VFKNAPVGMGTLNLDGRFVTANPTFQRMLGYGEDELRSLTGVDITHEDDRAATRRQIDEMVAGGRQSYQMEKRYRRKDGQVIWVLVNTSIIPASGSTPAFFAGVVVDMTERIRAQQERERLRQLEADLAHMNRVSMMGELAASLVHEITQPVGSAGNNARAALNFLDQRPPDLGEIREALGCVVGDTDRAGDIMDRIREHIKKAPPRKGRFDLNAAIDEVIALAHSAIIKNGVSVETRLADGLLPVQGDRVQLQQVTLNLILNAVDAMGSVEAGARELSISTEQTQTGGVLVAVRDSGPGIVPGQLERVFEPFYTTKSSGVGMGLSICRSIIDAHGGRLWADVNAPRGALFQFTFPGAENELMNSLRAAHQTREA
jgi:PAS domain S-box-containing protein